MREHPCGEVTEYQGSPVALQVTAIAKVPKGAGAIFRQKRKKRKSPINVASNLLPESPVSLAHGGEVHHVIFNRRAYSSRIRVPSRKKTFATLSNQKRFSSRYRNTGAPVAPEIASHQVSGCKVALTTDFAPPVRPPDLVRCTCGLHDGSLIGGI
jgi:hypothetical protein